MKPIAFPQLCRLSRAILETNLAMTDADWVEEIKVKIARGGWAYPRLDELTRAMRAVERIVPRPIPGELLPKHQEIPQPAAPQFSKSEAATAYKNLERLWKLRANISR